MKSALSQGGQGAGRRRGRTVVSAEAVFQCIVDMTLANPRVSATRQAVAQELGVKYTLIDDHIDKLLERGRIRRVISGIFEPTEIRPDRAVSVTTLPDGMVKLELGDECIELTPREIRMVLQGLGGYGMQYDRLQKGRDWARMAADMNTTLKATQRQLREVAAELDSLKRRGPQLPLDLAPAA